MALIDSCPIVEDRIIDSVCGLTYCKCETAPHCNFEHLFVFDGLQSSGMVSDLAIADADLAVRIRAPNHSLVVCVNDHKE